MLLLNHDHHNVLKVYSLNILLIALYILFSAFIKSLMNMYIVEIKIPINSDESIAKNHYSRQI